MTVAEARNTIRQFARNAGDNTMYPDAEVDRAIAAIGYRFVRKTKCTRTKSTLVLTINNNSLPAFPAGFVPQYVSRARVSGNSFDQDVKITDYNQLLDQREADASTGVIQWIAFDTYTTGEVWPKPDFAYTVTLWWFEPFNTSTYNIADAWLYEVLIYGGTAMLQQNEPQNQAYVANAWQKYLELEMSAMGSGNLGVMEYEAEIDSDAAGVATLDNNGQPVIT